MVVFSLPAHAKIGARGTTGASPPPSPRLGAARPSLQSRADVDGEPSSSRRPALQLCVFASGLTGLLLAPSRHRLGARKHVISTSVLRRAQTDAGVAVITREDVERKMKPKFDKERWWRVLLHNDDIHTFEYVTGCLTRVVKHLSRRKAYKITWEAHSSQLATVATVWKALADDFCVQLQQLGLTVSVAPDSQFRNNKSGD